MLKEPFKGILVFSAVETVAVVVWGAILGVGAHLLPSMQILAGVVLFAGYVVEHVIALNVSRGLPYLRFPPGE